MSLADSRLAYQDCFDYFEKALEDSTGLRLAVESQSAAYHLRMRFHQARKLDRRDNRIAYERGHRMHGASIYDELVVRIKEDTDGEYWVYLERAGGVLAAEPLSGDEDGPTVA